MVEKISAVTLRVANMRASVRFYKDVLGLEIIYGGEGSYFTSLRTKGGHTILNLEHGTGRIPQSDRPRQRARFSPVPGRRDKDRQVIAPPSCAHRRHGHA
jgi:catechol 2,3-dioxygenase-like lactoylglutathione lyase family enzyme